MIWYIDGLEIINEKYINLLSVLLAHHDQQHQQHQVHPTHTKKRE